MQHAKKDFFFTKEGISERVQDKVLHLDFTLLLI